MELTLFSAIRRSGSGGQGWVLDSNSASIRPRGRGSAFKSTRKSASLLLLLAAKRLDIGSASNLGWVDLSDISNLPEWAGARTAVSLAAQVRREIKVLDRVCPGVIDTPQSAKLKGPFRLSCVPQVDPPTARSLAQFCGPLEREHSIATGEALYSWLEYSEPVWRAGHYFDKPGEALSNLPSTDGATTHEPLVKALAFIASAKRLREMGSFVGARKTVESAATAAADEPLLPVRQHLQALCELQHAWLDYRQGDLDSAERRIASTDTIASHGALLKLRGQMLNLRSLIRRSRRRYRDSLDDLRHAARLFVLDGDLFHLFAVYHNLACLVAAEASDISDRSARDAMYRLALRYSQRNEAYCRRYGVGHNSVLNKLLQIGLHRELRRT